MKLLYAEDEAAMSEAVVDILTYHNYMVDPVYDGEEALAYAQSGHYDGIILDIMMPKLDGLEVLRRLRAEGCRTPMLLLTAKAEVEDQVQGLDLGADDYLPKPFPWTCCWPGCVPCSAGGRSSPPLCCHAGTSP